MKAPRTPNEMESKAAAALNAVLHQVSSIKTRDIQFQPARRKSDILASIDVLGRSHKLVCNVADGQPEDVKKAVEKLRTCAEGKKEGATPVLIAPFLSAQTREICQKNRIGFIDLQGNARLEVDEVFIGKRSVHSAPGTEEKNRYTA